MTITLLEREYHQLWQNSYVIELETFETLEKCPKLLGSGYQRWIFLKRSNIRHSSERIKMGHSVCGKT